MLPKLTLALLSAITLILLVTKFALNPPALSTVTAIPTATWTYQANGQTLTRPIRLGTGLTNVNYDLADCCHGTYDLSIKPTPQSTSGIYLPAVGGQFSVETSGNTFDFHGVDASSVGPIIALSPATRTVRVHMDGPSMGWTGIWKSPPLVGDLIKLDAIRQRDFFYQVIMPAVTGFAMLALAACFAYVYLLTERQFPAYRDVVVGLVFVALFQLVLAGLLRSQNLWLGGVLHYPVRALECLGIFQILTSYVAVLRRDQNMSMTKSLVRYRQFALFFVSFGAVLAVLGFAGVWRGPNAAIALLYPLAFIPLLRWPLAETKYLSGDFLGFVFALFGLLGSCFDGAKLIGRFFGVFVAYDYFNRITTPAVVIVTVFILADHFRRLLNDQSMARARTAHDEAIVQTMQMVAHDMRRPFSLLATTMAVLKSSELPEPVRVQIDRATQTVSRALASVNGLIDDVLAVGVAPRLVLESCDLRGLLDEAAELAAGADRPRHCSVLMGVEKGVVVRVDRFKIVRVFANIIDNALQATPGGGQIKVDVVLNESPERVRVRIFNSGSHVAPDDLKKIFDAFFTKGKRQGTGLGLAVAKKIVEAHSGQISCESSPATGTTFVVALPLELSITRHAASHFECDRIIVVDDDPFMRDAYAQLLAPRAIRAYGSPQEFWAAVASEPENFSTPLCVVTDYYFGASNAGTGLDFARDLKQRFDQIVVVLCTDYVPTTDEAAAVDRFLPKGELSAAAILGATPAASGLHTP